MVIARKYHFYAAHRNKHAGEKCARIHGHTYDVVCYFRFPEQDQETGITLPFAEIDRIVDPIIRDHDHWFLVYQFDPICQILDFMGELYKELPFETSAENLAKWLFILIRDNDLPIYKIELSETKSSIIIYEP